MEIEINGFLPEGVEIEYRPLGYQGDRECISMRGASVEELLSIQQYFIECDDDIKEHDNGY